MHTSDHELRLSLVIGHPFGIFSCSGLQFECTTDGCEYRYVETSEEYKRLREERKKLFCGTVMDVGKRGCTCGRATKEEVADLRREADEMARDINCVKED